MDASEVHRSDLWRRVFGGDPSFMAKLDDDTLAKDAAAFTTQVFERLAQGNVSAGLVEDLGEILSRLSPDQEAGAPPKRPELVNVVDDNLRELVKAGLVPVPRSVKERAENARQLAAAQEAIAGQRAVLLRVRTDDVIPRRFPRWVQDLLLKHAIEAIREDVIAYTTGQPSQAREIALMLAANYAAIREPKHKARFIDLLKQLCNRSEDYMDPFLRDLVFIADRITRPEDVDEVVRVGAVAGTGGGRR